MGEYALKVWGYFRYLHALTCMLRNRPWSERPGPDWADEEAFASGRATIKLTSSSMLYLYEL